MALVEVVRFPRATSGPVPSKGKRQKGMPGVSQSGALVRGDVAQLSNLPLPLLPLKLAALTSVLLILA